MYQLETNLQNLSTADYLACGKKAFQQLGWKLIDESPTSIVAVTPVAWQQNQWGETVTVEIANDMAIVTGKRTGKFPFDGGRNKENVQRYLEQFTEVMQEQDQILPANASSKVYQRRYRTLKWWEKLLPRPNFFITPMLILINIGFYVENLGDGVHWLNPTADSLAGWGANVKSVTGGAEQYWRLFTYMFLHAGIIHLLVNMTALAIIGLKLEPAIGTARFGACYIASGVLAGFASYLWNENVISTGAAGAVFGMYGVFVALFATKMIERRVPRLLLVSAIAFVLYNAAYGIFGGIDNAANIGGLISGILTGYLMYFFIRSQIFSNEWMQGSATVATILVALLLTVTFIRDPYRDFGRALEDFSVYEKEAMTFYGLPVQTKDYVAISHLHSNTIPNWKKCQTELQKLEKLKLPPRLVERKNWLTQYVDLHLRLSQRYIDKLGEYTQAYDEEIADMEFALEALTEQLYGKSKQFRRPY
jgi:rhomboid protease GluP